MTVSKLGNAARLALGLVLVGSAAPTMVSAADHGDAPRASADRETDIADVYPFLDPNDNSQLVILFNVGGFIVPGEAANFGFFDETLRYTVQIETNGDARPDLNIHYRFQPRVNAASEGQRVTVELFNGRTFQAMTTAATTAAVANPFVINTDPATGVQFFGGLVDDPFFFDIPAFGAFISSARAGAPNPAIFNRGRDSFAGYNCLTMAIRMPVAMLGLRPTPQNPTGTVIGVQGIVERRKVTLTTKDGPLVQGSFEQVERMGNPGVNVVLIPFPRKNAQNLGTTLDDAAGAFAPDIVGFLRSVGTQQPSIDVLASVAVTRGDFLRLDTSIANSGPGGGTNPGAGFPNGRRLRDDVVDVLSFFINNQQPLGDNVNGNDVPLGDVFPFLAPQQTARPNGTIEDNTRN